MVDVILVVIVVLCVIWGYVRGGVLDVLGLAALVAAYFASAPLAPWVAGVLMDKAGWSAGASYVVGRLIAGLFVYIPLIILASVIDRRIGRTEEGVPYPWNRLLGAVCGLTTGLIFTFILLFLVDVAVKVFPEASGWLVESARRSALRQWASASNPADRYLLTDGLRLLRAAQQDPAVLTRLSKDPEVRKLLDSSELKALTEDKEFTDAVRRRKVGAILSNEHFRRVLEDRQLWEIIVSPGLHAAIRKALDEARSAKQPAPEQ